MDSKINLKTRREFLRHSLLGTALTWTIPSFLSETFAQLHAESINKATQIATGKDANILVVLQLAGGNDGLNTVVPVGNDYYYKARPGLGIPEKNVLKLNDEFGLHPAMAGFKELFDAGQLSIVHGVGYPNPNRSHFRSTEIWQTASDSNQNEKYGWIGRYFDNACKGEDPTVGICISRQTPQAFASKKPIGVTLENPESYQLASGDPEGKTGEFLKKLNSREMMAADLNSGASIASISGMVQTESSPLDYLQRTALDAQVSSENILALSKKAQNQASYPASQISNSLRLVAKLIAGGLPTKVYYVSQGGYDTHANQVPSQQRLLGELAGSVKAFMEDLKAQGNADRVLLMTFSEFGRRVSQNANAGTDHGAAAPMFIAGPKVKAGFAGKFPSLAPADLLNGDIRFTTDFRSVYAGVLEGWLKTNSQPILKKKFEPLFCV